MVATTTALAATSSYAISIADTKEQIRAAQRLRFRVFSEEMGARLNTTVPGHDADGFDGLADHLIVTDTTCGAVVGTYRLTPPGRCARSYSEAEFDLWALYGIRPQMVEAGRSCVHPDHRNGAVINLIWAGLARYVYLSGYRYLAGCASVPLADGGQAAANAWLLGTAKHAAPEEMRVFPRHPWTPPQVRPDKPSYAQLPPLLRGYLRIGAWMCGAPAHDEDFGTADFFVLLDLERLHDRYRRHFLGEHSLGESR